MIPKWECNAVIKMNIVHKHSLAWKDIYVTINEISSWLNIHYIKIHVYAVKLHEIKWFVN